MSIFISIASYRDHQCKDTINSLFYQAKYPENIFIGVCEQNMVGETNEKCSVSKPEYESHIRKITLKHFEAKGPTYARYLCSTLWKDEKYFLQIDSHMLFVKNWDEICISMFEDEKQKRGNGKFVLSYYPKGYEEHQDDDNGDVPRICKAIFSDNELVSQDGAELVSPGEIYETPFIAAGFIFTEAEPFLQEIPFDPFLDYLFVGEEFLIAARLYTNGWSILSPSKNIAYHHYTRADSPKFWDQDRYDEGSVKKVKHILKLSEETAPDKRWMLEKYGLGSKRSLEDFWNFAGVDWRNKTIRKNFCHPDQVIEEKHQTKTEKAVNTVAKVFSWTCLAILLLILVAVIGVVIYKYWPNASWRS